VVHFQAPYANECWQFDVSPSDLKALPEPPLWIDARRGHPVLMLYSVVDDHSGVAYQEYHVIYSEGVPAALRFLFRAIAPKTIEEFPFQGRPHMLYLDHEPIATLNELMFPSVLAAKRAIAGPDPVLGQARGALH
jgi:putative transposase